MWWVQDQYFHVLQTILLQCNICSYVRYSHIRGYTRFGPSFFLVSCSRIVFINYLISNLFFCCNFNIDPEADSYTVIIYYKKDMLFYINIRWSFTFTFMILKVTSQTLIYILCKSVKYFETIKRICTSIFYILTRPLVCSYTFLKLFIFFLLTINLSCLKYSFSIKQEFFWY